MINKNNYTFNQLSALCMQKPNKYYIIEFSCAFNSSKTFDLTVYSYHVTYAFQSESTLYSCLNVKELLAGSRREIWSLSDCNCTRTHNHLVHKRTLNHLAKLASLAKWLSVRLWTKWLWFRVQLQSLTIWFDLSLLIRASQFR